jgi:hypothetical protein
MEKVDEIKLTEEERQKYKLSIAEVEKIEEDLNISFFDLVNDMSESKMPRVKIIRTICGLKGIEKEDISELVNVFSKIAIATFSKKN